MANKKISQLTSMGTVGIGTDDYFVTAESLAAGKYATVKSTPGQVAEFVLNPIAAAQISGEDKDVYFDNNDNWDTASNTVTQNPYLQVRVSDGKLVTGSGIANAVGGDNMGDCVATQPVNMQGLDINNLGNIGFQGATDSKLLNINAQDDVRLQAGRDLIVSGNNNVILKAQGVALNNGGQNTPFVGEVRITGGDLVVDPDNKLVVNEIVGIVGEAATDESAVSINGAFRNVPTPTAQLQEVNWPDSNIQYRSTSTAGAINVDFTEPADGQTLTMYWRNTNSNTAADVTFRWGVGVDNKVRFGADDGPGVNVAAPKVAAQKTNVFTFVRIGDRIFGSAITGYVY